MPDFSPAQAAAVNLGLFVLTIGSVLSVVWLVLQIIAWFRPKEVYATRAELRDLEVRLTGFGTKLDTLTTTMQAGFNDIQRSIGRLEGTGHVP